MRILRLEAENVKRLKALEVAPPPGLVVVSGKNGQGKTSLLDSIMYALGGRRTLPVKPIREGSKKAKVSLDLGEFVVERTWTSNERSYLSVKPKDGEEIAGPQELLDKLVGSISFDPLSFIRMKDEKQVQTIKDLTGLDFSDLEARRKKKYDERTQINRDIAQLEAQLKDKPRPEAPTKAVSVTDLLDELNKRRTIKQENDEARAEVKEYDESIALKTADIKTKKKAAEDAWKVFQEAEGDLKAAEKLLENTKKLRDKAKDVADKLVDPNTADIEKRIGESETVNAQVRARDEYDKTKTDIRAKQEQADLLTDQIDALDQEKASAIAAAKLPVDGLSFTEDGVTYNGIPFEQCSQAEQLKVSLAMSLAFNPTIRIILIRDGSLLDDENMKLIGQVAQEYDAQIWIERVEEGKVGIIIEDGTIKEVRE